MPTPHATPTRRPARRRVQAPRRPTLRSRPTLLTWENTAAWLDTELGDSLSAAYDPYQGDEDPAAAECLTVQSLWRRD